MRYGSLSGARRGNRLPRRLLSLARPRERPSEEHHGPTVRSRAVRRPPCPCRRAPDVRGGRGQPEPRRRRGQTARPPGVDPGPARGGRGLRRRCRSPVDRTARGVRGVVRARQPASDQRSVRRPPLDGPRPRAGGADPERPDRHRLLPGDPSRPAVPGVQPLLGTGLLAPADAPGGADGDPARGRPARCVGGVDARGRGRRARPGRRGGTPPAAGPADGPARGRGTGPADRTGGRRREGDGVLRPGRRRRPRRGDGVRREGEVPRGPRPARQGAHPVRQPVRRRHVRPAGLRCRPRGDARVRSAAAPRHGLPVHGVPAAPRADRAGRHPARTARAPYAVGLRRVGGRARDAALPDPRRTGEAVAPVPRPDAAPPRPRTRRRRRGVHPRRRRAHPDPPRVRGVRAGRGGRRRRGVHRGHRHVLCVGRPLPDPERPAPRPRLLRARLHGQRAAPGDRRPVPRPLTAGRVPLGRRRILHADGRFPHARAVRPAGEGGRLQQLLAGHGRPGDDGRRPAAARHRLPAHRLRGHRHRRRRPRHPGRKARSGARGPAGGVRPRRAGAGRRGHRSQRPRAAAQDHHRTGHRLRAVRRPHRPHGRRRTHDRPGPGEPPQRPTAVSGRPRDGVPERCARTVRHQGTEGQKPLSAHQ
ncbi:hypothetical protein SGPA1_10631 [Streptomyces misionensis JCM 4497]